MSFHRTNLAQQLRVFVCDVCLLHEHSCHPALHSMNPTLPLNNDPSSLSNEIHDLIDAHIATLTQEHIALGDNLHPHSLLLQILHQQFKDHLVQQLRNLRQYTTHQQLLIHQFVGNSAPHYPDTTHTTPTPTPTPTSTPTQTSATHLDADVTFVTQSGKGPHVASFIPGKSAVLRHR